MRNIYHGGNTKFTNLLETNCFIRDFSQIFLLESKCKIKYLLGIKIIILSN